MAAGFYKQRIKKIWNEKLYNVGGVWVRKNKTFKLLLQDFKSADISSAIYICIVQQSKFYEVRHYCSWKEPLINHIQCIHSDHISSTYSPALITHDCTS
jgi:hypothetical protein